MSGASLGCIEPLGLDDGIGNHSMVRRIIAGGVVVALLILAFRLSQPTNKQLHVSGFIEADDIRVGSRVGGRVHQLWVREGQRVHPGDLLVELEPFDLLERRAEAAAVLAQRQAALEQRKAGFRAEEIAQAKARRDQLAAYLAELIHGPRSQEIATAQAELALATAEHDLALLEQKRLEALQAKGAAAQEELDRARRAFKVALARLHVRQEQLALLTEGTRPEEIDQARAQLAEAEQVWKLRTRGYRSEEIAEATAAVKAAEAALHALDRHIAELKIYAPVEGIVEATGLHTGDLVAANSPVLSLIDTRELWVRAYVPENHLDLQLGQDLRVTVDSFPDRSFEGRLTFVARQAEFTPGNVQTPEDRSQQAFRIKVTLQEGLDVLRPGMAADVWLDDGERRP
jgi:multidrug resistance efflux pump